MFSDLCLGTRWGSIVIPGPDYLLTVNSDMFVRTYFRQFVASQIQKSLKNSKHLILDNYLVNQILALANYSKVKNTRNDFRIYSMLLVCQSLVERKPVVGASDQVRHRPALVAT